MQLNQKRQQMIKNHKDFEDCLNSVVFELQEDLLKELSTERKQEVVKLTTESVRKHQENLAASVE